MTKPAKGTRVAFYVRVSTDDQTVDNQLRELQQWADRSGLEVVHVYRDEGISGAKGRDQRPGLDALLKDAVRRRFDVVASWAVDRMGRSLADLVSSLQCLHGAGVDLYLHQQAIDTRTPAGKAMFQMMGVFAEFERSMIQERVKAGMARAKDKGATFGRPAVDDARLNHVRELLRGGMGQLKAAKVAGVGTSIAQREAKALRAAGEL